MLTSWNSHIGEFPFLMYTQIPMYTATCCRKIYKARLKSFPLPGDPQSSWASTLQSKSQVCVRPKGEEEVLYNISKKCHSLLLQNYCGLYGNKIPRTRTDCISKYNQDCFFAHKLKSSSWHLRYSSKRKLKLKDSRP